MTTAGNRSRLHQVAANSGRFLESLGVPVANLVRAQQVHGTQVAVVSARHAGRSLPRIDALVARDRRVLCSVTVADCLPIFLYDPKRAAFGVVHGGWRSLQQGILRQVVTRLQASFLSLPEHLLVGIGPGISPCHYAVGDDVAAKFRNYAPCLAVRDHGQMYLDLKRVAAMQLQACAVRPEHIEISPECTYCRADKYFSFRRDHPAVVEAMLAVIGFR